MPIEISSVTSQLLNRALDVSMQTHKVIANNVANVNTQDFRPLHVDFDAVMENVKQAVNTHAEDSQLKASFDSIDIESYIAIDDTYQQVKIEQEMVEMAKNTLRYQAIIDAKKTLGSMMSMAIRGGR